jgi:hypothetical protein
MKLQTPITKGKRRAASYLSTLTHEILVLGIWDFIGCWRLVLGTSRQSLQKPTRPVLVVVGIWSFQLG